jgi:hypothetical protein
MSDIKTVISKLDKLDERIDSIDITLAKQHVSLDEHIRRTELNEKALELMAEETNGRLKKLESSKDMIMGGVTIITILAAVIMFFNDLGFKFFK